LPFQSVVQPSAARIGMPATSSTETTSNCRNRIRGRPFVGSRGRCHRPAADWERDPNRRAERGDYRRRLQVATTRL